jgi:hypothetical protein
MLARRPDAHVSLKPHVEASATLNPALHPRRKCAWQ